MRIVICASIDFSDKIKDVFDKLKKQGHEIDLPLYTLKIIKGEITLEEYKKIKEKEGDINLRKKAGIDLIKRHFNNIKNSDAILVLNYEKKGIPNYIGGNTFLEIGFAHVLDKKIFLYNDLPDMIYNDELQSMNITLINQDLSRIK